MYRYPEDAKYLRRALSRLALILALLGMCASMAHGYALDARRMAMGGAAPPKSSRLKADNPAYTIIPERYEDRGFQIPVPLGLINLFSEMPEFDPNEPDFDPIKLINLITNVPWHLDLEEPEELDGDINLELAADEVIIFWEDAHLFIPEKPFDLGFRWDRWGITLHRGQREKFAWRLSVNPYLDVSGRTVLDDALYGILAEGEPVTENAAYTGTTQGMTMGGLAWKLLFAKRIGLDSGRSLYLAAAPKLITGFAMASYNGLFGIKTEAGDISETLDTTFEQTSQYSDGFSTGYGLAWDLGIALRAGPLDLGIGVRDLGGKVTFKNTKIDFGQLTEVDDPENPGETISDVVNETLFRDVEYEYEIDEYYTINASFDWRGWLFLGETKIRPHRESLHLGAERWIGTFAVRGGMQQDSEANWQYSAGCGMLLDSGFEINVALETHDRYLQDEQGIALGLSLNL